MTELLQAHKEYSKYYDKIADYFDQGDPLSTARYIFAYCKRNIVYKVEPERLQTVKAPQAILAQGKTIGGDCKHYASFINGVLASLQRRKGYPYKLFFRFANYSPDTVIPQHVFSVMVYKGKEYWIDPVLDEFDEKKQYINKVDKKADMLQRVSGVGCSACSHKQKQKATIGNAPPTGLDDTGNPLVSSPTPTRNPPWGPSYTDVALINPITQKPIASKRVYSNQSWHWSTWQTPNMYGWWRNINDPAPPAGLDDTGTPMVDSEKPTRNPPWNGGWHWSSFRDQKDSKGNLLYGWFQDWTRTGLSAVIHDVGEFVDKAITDVRELLAKGLLAVPRNAFLGLLKLNVGGLADWVYNVRAQHQDRLFNMWDHDLGGSVSVLNRSIDEGHKKTALAGLGAEPTSTAALLASASPILAAIATISGAVATSLKALGLDKSQPSNKIDDAKQRLINQVKQTGPFCDASFCYKLDASGNLIMTPKQSITQGNGIPTPVLLLGGAAAVYLLSSK